MPNWARSTRRLSGHVAAALAVTLATAGAAQAAITPPAEIGRSVVDADIRAPHAAVTTPDGSIYAAEFGAYTPAPGQEATARRRVVKYTPNRSGGYTRTVVVGTPGGAACGEGESGDLCGDGGPATQAKLGRLSGLAIDAEGRIYIAESFWYRMRVVGTDGIIRTVTPPEGGLHVPEGMAYDATTDSVLVTDKRNHRLMAVKATDATGPVEWRTVAGIRDAPCASATAACGDGGNATAAQLTLPGAVAADGKGNIYLADSGAQRIRRITGGRIFAFAGNGAQCQEGQACGDGGLAVNASLGRTAFVEGESDGEGPFGVATTPNGVVYIADSDIDRVRRVLPDKRIETVMEVEHPKALFALATPTGHDMIVPEWDRNVLSRLENVDTDTARQTLTVTRGGTGAGTVAGTGIACGTDCSETVLFGTEIALTATAAAGSTFTGWSGACTGTAACTVKVDAARTATATFTKDAPPPPDRKLTASITGSGTVTGGGLSCGTTCTATHPDGSAVTLTATPAAGQRFVRWTGACSATTPTCSLTLSADRAVAAVFEAIPVVTPPQPQPQPQPQPPVLEPVPPAPALSLKASVLGSRTVGLGRSIRLRYTLSARAALSLEVRPAKGAVQRIALGTRAAGSGTVTWNGRLRGRKVAGRYTLVLVAKAGGVTRRTSFKVTVRRS